MIISASRRTDLPAFYSEWLFQRLKEEYVLVRNPMNIHQIGRISLSPNVVDGIVFWTKNPAPMLDRISELEKYTYYFQFTLTPYERDVETSLPSKEDVIIPTFQKLSAAIGKERVVWRYDPILFNSHYDMEYHCNAFQKLADRIGKYTEKCTVSFLDLYRNTAKNVKSLQLQVASAEQQLEVMERFSKIAAEYGFYIDTCAEKIDLSSLRIPHACCIDKNRLEKIGGYRLPVKKDPHQRPECGCVESIDIGAYNTCMHGCLYCYANYSVKAARNNAETHNPFSPLQFGVLNDEDVIKDRAMESLKDYQLSLFDL